MTKFRTGLTGDYTDPRDYDASALLGSGEIQELPKKVDLSGGAPVKNQGACGSCTAFAATICHEIQNTKEHDSNIEFDAQYLFDTYQIPSGGACSRGDYLHNAVKQIVDHGSMTIGGEVYKTDGYARVYSKLPEDLKPYLAKGNPIMFGMNVMTTNSIATGTTSEEAIWDYNTGKWKYDPTSGGHAIAIVGYNDDTQEFKIQNSWGKKYGDNGFVYIPYDKMTKYMYNSTYVIYDKEDVEMICADVSSKHWYGDAVRYVIDKGFMTTDENGRFRPEEFTPEVSSKTNRAAVAQILFNLGKLGKFDKPAASVPSFANDSKFKYGIAGALVVVATHYGFQIADESIVEILNILIQAIENA